ncbi:hypothetical protein MRY82_02485 [bacterium]|nr:hypothetical protein [bacterium]
MNLKSLGYVALSALIVFLSACSESLLPEVKPDETALLPNINAYCSETNPASYCRTDFDDNEAQIFLFSKSSDQQSAFANCASIESALEAQTFDLSPVAVGLSEIDCEDDGTNTFCHLEDRVSWEGAEFGNLLELEKDDYLVLVVFKTSEDEDIVEPEPGDYIQCAQMTLEEDTVEEDFDLDASTDTLNVDWPFVQIPGISFTCTETANADCTVAQNGADVAYAFYKNTSCSAIQTGVEDALITADKHIVGDTTSLCQDVTSPESCAAGTPSDWSYDGGSTTEDILAGSYAVVAHMGDTSGFPIEGDVVSCKEVQVDQSVSMISLQESDLLSITWPTLASLEQVDMSCSETASENCTVDSIDGNEGFHGYIKDQSCAQILSALEAGNQNSLDMHAQGMGTASCNDSNPDTCSMSVSSWASGADGGPSMMTEVPQGNYAVISFVDQLGDGNPTPGDVLHCKEVTLTTTPIGNIALDNDDLVEPEYPIIFVPSLTAICDDSAGGSTDCVAALNGNDANFFFFPATSCSSLLSGGEVQPTHFSVVAASCDGSTPNTCTQMVMSDEWEDEDFETVNFIEKGNYAVAGFINANGQGEEPESGDPLWCKEVVLGSSSSSLSLGNGDLMSF